MGPSFQESPSGTETPEPQAGVGAAQLLDQAAEAETVTLRVLLAQSSRPQAHLLARRNL